MEIMYYTTFTCTSNWKIGALHITSITFKWYNDNNALSLHITITPGPVQCLSKTSWVTENSYRVGKNEI